MQALIVGEIECHHNLRKDFEKLLVADSLVYFFAFPEEITENMAPLDFFQTVADTRRQYAA
ncbi:MAG: hypothetical protein WCA22_20070 [Candidatus Binatus sp.]